MSGQPSEIHRAVSSTLSLRPSIILALVALGSVFIPTSNYPVLLAVGGAEVRVQDVCLAAFIGSVIVDGRDLRQTIAKVAISPIGLMAAFFVVLIFLSFIQIPASSLGRSTIAAGKLVEFALVGTLAGIVLFATGSVRQFTGVLAAGAGFNAILAILDGIKEEGWRAITLRLDGLLGPNSLAVGGAAAALCAWALWGSRARGDRTLALLAASAGIAAILAGKSLGAAGAFLGGTVFLFLTLRQPPKGVGVVLATVILAVVLASRHSDVGPLFGLRDSMQSRGESRDDRPTAKPNSVQVPESSPRTALERHQTQHGFRGAPTRISMLVADPLASSLASDRGRDLNLVRNSSFELGTDAWFPTSRGVHVRTRHANVKFGDWAGLVEPPGRHIGEGIVTSVGEISGGAVYSLGAWVRGRESAPLALGLEWLDKDRSLIRRTITAFSATGRWQRVVLPAQTAPRKAASVLVTLTTAPPWRYVVAAYDGRRMHLCVDGRVEGSRISQLSLSNTSSSFRLGVPRFSSGMVDEVAVYGRGLTERQCRLHYRAGRTRRYAAQVLADRPVAYWRFRSIGQLIVDSVNKARVIGVPNGTPTAIPGVVPDGHDRGVSLDGRDDYIDFGDHFGFSGRRPFSLEVWLKTEASSSGALLLTKATGSSGYALRVTGRGASWDRHRGTNRDTLRVDDLRVDVPKPRAFAVDGVQIQQRSNVTPYTPEPNYAGGDLVHRMILFYIGAQILFDHPLAGVGWLQGSTPRYMASPRYRDEAQRLLPNAPPQYYPSTLNPQNAHNAYLQIAIDAGIPALLAFVGMIIASLISSIRSAQRLQNETQLPGALSGAIVVLFAIWLNSIAVFGGSLETALLWGAVGAAGASRALTDQIRD